MGAVAGCTSHFPFFIERKIIWDFYFFGRDDTRLVFPIVMHFLARVYSGTIVTGEAHFSICYRWFIRERCKFRASLFNKKGIDPAIMTDSTFFGRIWL